MCFLSSNARLVMQGNHLNPSWKFSKTEISVGNIHSLKTMFASPQFKENISSFQKLHAEGVFDLSLSEVKPEDCRTLKRLTLGNLRKSKWVEQYNLLKVWYSFEENAYYVIKCHCLLLEMRVQVYSVNILFWLQDGKCKSINEGSSVQGGPNTIAYSNSTNVKRLRDGQIQNSPG